MKPVKIISIVFGSFLVITGGLLAYVYSSFDAARIKQEITKVVKDKKGRTLTIEGDLQLSVWPNIGVNLGKTTLSEHNSTERFASLDGVRVSVELKPLLAKQLVINKIDINGLDARLIRHKDGSLNIADLMSKEKEESPALRFDIASINVKNSKLSWIDESKGEQLNLSGFELHTGHLANTAKGALLVSVQATGDKPKAQAAITLAGNYDVDLEKKQYALSNLKSTIKGQLAGIDGLDLVLVAEALNAKPEQKQFAIDKLELTASGKEAANGFEIKLDAPKLSLAGETASGSATLSAKLKAEGRSVDARLDLSGIEGNADAVKIAKLGLNLDAQNGESVLKALLGGALDADLKKQTISLAKLEGNADISDPAMPMKQVKLPLNGHLQADLAKQTASGALNTQFDESTIAAKFDVSRFAPLALGFGLDINTLNLDKYLPPKKPAEGTSGKTGSPAGDAKIDLSALKALNLNGSIKIGKFQVSNIKLANLRADIKAANGRVDVSPLSANLYGGSTSGNLSAQANGNILALKQTLSGVEVGPLVRDVANKDALEGRGTVVIDISTRGETVSALKKALAGAASLTLKDGAIKGINLAQSFREAKAKLTGKQDAEQKAKATDKTDFAELAASFKINAGVAHNEDLNAKSPFLRLTGAGDLDIGNSSINYLAKAAVVNTSGGQGAKDLEHLKGLTIPVRLSGPFDNLSYKLEFGSLLSEASKAKVEQKKEEVKEKVKDQAKDKLKGLFGK